MRSPISARSGSPAAPATPWREPRLATEKRGLAVFSVSSAIALAFTVLVFSPSAAKAQDTADTDGSAKAATETATSSAETSSAEGPRGRIAAPTARGAARHAQAIRPVGWTHARRLPPASQAASLSDPYVWAPYFGPYSIAPTIPQKRYAAWADTETPRLGLSYTYPENPVFGLRLPEEANPYIDVPLPPFEGIVGSPVTPNWLWKQHGGEGGEAPLSEPTRRRYGLDLLAAGKFREAGRALADGFRASDDPRYPLYLVEALVGIESYEHAELMLRHALSLPDFAEALPSDVASHFPSREDFERRYESLRSAVGDGVPLLRAYLGVFTKDAGAAISELARMMDAGAPGAAELYRHYFGRIFGAESAESVDGSESSSPEEPSAESTPEAGPKS
jgi:hypothetical protein